MNTINKITKASFLLGLILCFSTISLAQGPNSPEAAGFEPVDATDMVNLTNGNLTYVLPLLDVEGFPINLSYHAGISPDLEASWVGLGWYLNPGAINRAVNGTPDDWKSGVGINFTSYDETKEYHSITAGVGLIGVPVKIGIGANWGGGQGISGSVSAQAFFVSLYGDTKGNVSASVGYGGMGASFSNGSKPVYSIGAYGGNSERGGGVGYSTDGTVSAGYGTAKGSIGMSFSGGGNFSMSGNLKGAGASVSSSSSSQSSGDATIDTQSIGLSVSIPIGPLSVSLGYRKTKVKVSIYKGYRHKEWGALYSSDFSNISGGIPFENNSFDNKDGFTDYMDRSHSYDSYSTRLPQSEKDFIGDYSKKIENINFTFMAYDSYNISAQGMIGNLMPRAFQNANIMGKGDVTTNEAGDPIHVFWHHGNATNNVQRSLNSTSKPFDFYFNGQYTKSESNDADAFNATSMSSLNMNNLLTEGNHTGNAIGNNRAHQGNYVEVFTNDEIANGQAPGLMTPKSIPNSSRANTAYFDPDGLGGYKITATDGKVYHFTIPVYHYERIKRSQLEEQEYRSTINSFPVFQTKYDCKNVNESRQYTRYATHWLLTGVTGPDYVDRPDPNSNNNTGTFNKEDYGYWVELEYGKWSDGFVWRTPYQDFVYDYNTNVKGEIGFEDKGYYQFGRKQLYYLDRINTRNRSALFIKDIRYDGYGKQLSYKFTNKNRSNNTQIGNSGNGASTGSLKKTDPYVHVKEEAVEYQREFTLRLDKIVLIDSDKASLIDKSGTSNLGTAFSSNIYTPNSTDSPNWSSPDFSDHYGYNYSYDIHQEQNILDIGDIPIGFIENNALKTIQLNQSYQLVKNTPSSRIAGNTYGGNNDAGRLTLNSIQVLGRGNMTFMPPTTFDYYDIQGVENPNFLPVEDNSKATIQTHIENRQGFMDSWGYMQDDYTASNGETRSKAEVWSLKDINTPTGATIEIDYEEDDYWTEAFSRRYWTDELQFKIINVSSTEFDIEIKSNTDEQLSETINFTDYFTEEELVFFDLWLSVWDRDAFSDTDRETIDILEKGFYPFIVDQDRLVFRLSKSLYITELDDSGDLFPHTFRNTSGNGSEHPPCPMPRGDWGDDNCNDGFNLVYKLLANQVPKDQTGGGLRVKEIVTTDGTRVNKAEFDYSHPTNVTASGEKRSSGITSYAPVDGLKFIPYQSELPPPGVMYEYVTMKETDISGNFNSKTRYRHHVLKPVLNIFDPNIEMEVVDSNAPHEDDLFWANVTEDIANLDGNNSKKVAAKKIDININTAMFGQVKSIEIFNTRGHLLNKIDHQYANGRELEYTDENRGFVKETFNSLKTVFVSSEDGTVINDNETKRLLSISSKTEYKSLLKKSINVSGGQTSYVEYHNMDPWLGNYRTKESTLADGTSVFNNTVPAYTKYSDMGSKVLNPNNKNMLTQEAMAFTSISGYVGNNTLNARITTWNDTWKYRDKSGNETIEDGVWRKHKSFVWKGDINPDNGTYVTTVGNNNVANNYFDWNLGTPTNSGWQKASEIIRYTHWSAPLETQDINDNYASTKMADNDTKVIANGNASFTEMFASGAEYDIDGVYLDQEIKGSQFRDTLIVHTGKYALKLNSGDKGFETILKSNEHVNDNYKISVWVFKGDTNVRLNINGRVMKFNGETVQAGNWMLYNHYQYLKNATYNISIATIGSNTYVDDFRIHPVYSGMNTYVYDEDTDELNYILDSNNMATKYVYDAAGRLCKLYKEVEADFPETDGGFKLINQYKYHYTGINNNGCDCCEGQTQSANSSYAPLTVKSIDETDKGAYKRTFQTSVNGGSGNYTYEWRWLTDFESNSFSNYIAGSTKQEIPFAVKMCDIKANTYNKIWVVELKATDTTTGEVITQKESVEFSGCKFVLSDSEWVDIEISTNYTGCNPFTNYTFRPFVIKPTHQDYTYEYQSFDHATNQWSVYSTITTNKNNFCTESFYAPSSSCKTEYSLYQTIRYRVIDNQIGNIYQSNIMDVYLDCVDNPDNGIKLISSAYHDKYNKFGQVVEKSSAGDIITTFNFTDKINNKK